MIESKMCLMCEANERLCIWHHRGRSASIMLTFTTEMSLTSRGIILLSRSRKQFYGQASSLSTRKMRSEQLQRALKTLNNCRVDSWSAIARANNTHLECLKVPFDGAVYHLSVSNSELNDAQSAWEATSEPRKWLSFKITKNF